MRKLILILFLIPCALYAQKDTTIYYYDTISSIRCSSHFFSTKCYIAVNNRIGKINEKASLFVKVGDTVMTIKHLYKKGGPTFDSKLKKLTGNSLIEDIYWE
jgi:hypothetical protein